MRKNGKNTPKSTLSKVLTLLRGKRALVALSVLFALIVVALTLYVPILIGNAIDLIVGKGNVDLDGILQILLKVGAAVVLTAVFQWLMTIVNNKIAFDTVRNIRNRAISKIESLPLSYIDSHPYGDIVSRVISDADQLADGLLLGFSQLFVGIITIIGTLIFMLSINPIIALVVVLITPVSLFVARFIAKHTYDMFKVQSVTRAEQTALIDEMIGNAKMVQAYGYGDEAEKRFDEVNERLGKCSFKATFYSSLVNPSTRFVNSLVYAGVGLVGAFTVISSGGAFSVGSLTVFLSYANQYTKPFNEISGVITELQNAFACASRIFELLEQPSRTPDKENAEKLQEPDGNVTLEGISFSYTEDKPLIKDFSLSVKAGQRIAIVGPTGCGKTTLINLLMRFYDVKDGAIKIEGLDIRDVTRESLRASVGMVLQDTWLMSGTVRENIVMGKPDATDDEVIAAAKLAHAHSFIMRLKDGYDTVLENNGETLSQGQKQRLCIARVMLCLPPILILDEATSSIDTRTELKIQESFSRMMQGRTSFIVAHRLSTIKEADLILVMKDGDIVEKGSHEELMAKGGFYTTLYNSQFEVT